MPRPYNILLVQPAGYEHSGALHETALLLHHTLQSLGHTSALSINTIDPSSINIVVGYHLLPDLGPLQKFPFIVLQLEQLLENDQRFSPQWLEFLSAALEVWDYSPQNIAALHSHGITRTKQLTLGYHPRLQVIPDQPKDIDVLFYGVSTPRRIAIFEQLNSRCRFAFLFKRYGPQRDAFIARSRILLNLHAHDHGIMEQARVSYLLNNQCFILSEQSHSNPYEGMLVTCPYDQLVDRCMEHLADDNHRNALRLQGAQRFREQLPMTEILRQVLEG